VHVGRKLALPLLLFLCGPSLAHEISSKKEPDAVFANDVSVVRARLEADQAFIAACEKHLPHPTQAIVENFAQWRTDNAPLLANLPAWIRLQGEIIGKYEKTSSAKPLNGMSQTNAAMYEEAELLVAALSPDRQQSSCLQFSIAALSSTLATNSDLRHHFERADLYFKSTGAAP
jgi:hypothetical protein